jgi:hypothetical protein
MLSTHSSNAQLSTPPHSLSPDSSSNGSGAGLIDPIGVTEDFSSFNLNPQPQDLTLPDSPTESLDSVADNLRDQLFSVQLGSTEFQFACDQLHLYDVLLDAHTGPSFRRLPANDRCYLLDLACHDPISLFPLSLVTFVSCPFCPLPFVVCILCPPFVTLFPCSLPCFLDTSRCHSHVPWLLLYSWLYIPKGLVWFTPRLVLLSTSHSCGTSLWLWPVCLHRSYSPRPVCHLGPQHRPLTVYHRPSSPCRCRVVTLGQVFSPVGA